MKITSLGNCGSACEEPHQATNSSTRYHLTRLVILLDEGQLKFFELNYGLFFDS